MSANISQIPIKSSIYLAQCTLYINCNALISTLLSDVNVDIISSISSDPCFFWPILIKDSFAARPKKATHGRLLDLVARHKATQSCTQPPHLYLLSLQVLNNFSCLVANSYSTLICWIHQGLAHLSMPLKGNVEFKSQPFPLRQLLICQNRSAKWRLESMMGLKYIYWRVSCWNMVFKEEWLTQSILTDKLILIAEAKVISRTWFPRGVAGKGTDRRAARISAEYAKVAKVQCAIRWVPNFCEWEWRVADAQMQIGKI